MERGDHPATEIIANIGHLCGEDYECMQATVIQLVETIFQPTDFNNDDQYKEVIKDR